MSERLIEVVVEDVGWTARLPQVEALVEGAAHAALDAVPSAPDGDIVVLLTNDAKVRDLNARFRGKEAPTNVLSFTAPATASGSLGDIALALGVCAAEARDQGKTLAHHLQHLVAHGVLHLLGYDHLDEVEAEAMEELERNIMAALGAPDPYTAQEPKAPHG
jgi:probable rRNA maturation factor